MQCCKAGAVGLPISTYHLHVVFSTIKPPMSGPISGPTKGLAVYTIMGADSSCAQVRDRWAAGVAWTDVLREHVAHGASRYAEEG